jgi:hypothetical protein
MSMGIVPPETGIASQEPTRSVWRPFASGVCALSLMALVTVPASLSSPAPGQTGAFAAPAPAAAGQEPSAGAPASAPEAQFPTSSPLALGELSAPTTAIARSGPPQAEGSPPAADAPSEPPVNRGGDDAPPPAGPGGDGGDDGGGDETSPLVMLAQAIPAPPDVPIPEVPAEVRPLAEALAPATFVMCSYLGLPGSLARVGVGVAGGSVPGLAEFVGALLLYQVPILDLCMIFGFPDEVVACQIDDQLRDQVPSEVPANPPAPAGTALGVTRGIEGTVAGDTSGSDQFLEQAGCEARPS